MADDLTRYVSPKIEARLRAKAEALGLEFNRYLSGIVNGEPWGWGENDPDGAIDIFIGDYSRATNSFMSLTELDAYLDERQRRRA